MFEWKSTDEKQLQNQIKTKSKHHEGHFLFFYLSRSIG